MELNEIIDYIKGMNEKDKLKLAIRINETVYTNIDYDKKKCLKNLIQDLKRLMTNTENIKAFLIIF